MAKIWDFLDISRFPLPLQPSLPNPHLAAHRGDFASAVRAVITAGRCVPPTLATLSEHGAI